MRLEGLISLSKKYSYGFLLLCLLVVISSCNKKLDFADEGPFVVLTTYPGGENYYVEFYPRHIAVHQDGKVRIYTEGSEEIIVEADAPIVEIKLAEKEIEGIKETIENNRFFKLEKDVSDPGVMDGPMQYITVHTKAESKEVGGEWPIDESFQAIREEILDYVGDEYDEWLDEIDTYIYDKNPSPTD